MNLLSPAPAAAAVVACLLAVGLPAPSQALISPPRGPPSSSSAGRSASAVPPATGRRRLPPASAPAPTALRLGDFFNFGGGGGNKREEEEKAAQGAAEAEADTNLEDGAYDADDPVEKIFGFFFGKREAAPAGLARFGPERFPELYPATYDEWADPVESDDARMSEIRPLLKNTNLESRGLTLTYDANRDGWDALKFHSLVDRKGGAVVVCTTTSGLICGGYNPKGWVGYGEARGSIAAFLFVLGGKGYAAPADGAPGVKLRKVGGPGLAQIDNPESAVSFGADSLVVPLGGEDGGNPRVARSKLGSYYERFPDGTNTLFGKDAQVQLKDLKVYHGVYEEGEYVPFTDAEPFALY